VILLVTHFSQKEISYPKKIWIALVEILIFVMLLKTSIMRMASSSNGSKVLIESD